VQAWNLLRDARDFYAKAAQHRAQGEPGAPTEQQLAKAFESLLTAEGSDWCWWYGPHHSSANDPEFDALYRKHLTEVYASLGVEAPEVLAQPIKKKPERALVVPPTAYLRVRVDGRETSYFEWLGAGLYSADRQSGAMHGRAFYLHELHYGFDKENLYIRVDAFAEAFEDLDECEFRITVRQSVAHVPAGSSSGQPDVRGLAPAQEELRVIARIVQGKLRNWALEKNDACLLGCEDKVSVAFGKILELRLSRELLTLSPQAACSGDLLRFEESDGLHRSPEIGQVGQLPSAKIEGSPPRRIEGLKLGVALWEGGLPVDVLPAEGELDVKLGADAYAWPST
jgi:hypothetical protein